MGRKKKRAAPNARDRIFCYYCDRTFQQEQELLSHQKEKHFRCPQCNKRMLSVQSMLVHADQMHNLRVTMVPNSVPGRESVAVDVLGMSGIPNSFYASTDDSHLPKRRRDNHLSPVALPHAAPTTAYVDGRANYITSSAPAAPPYGSAHLYSYGAQPATRAASHSYQHGATYNYSPPPAAHSASNYAYGGYNAPHLNYNAAQPAHSSASVAPAYAPSAGAAPHTNYAQPTSYGYTPAATLPPIRTTYPSATQPDYVQSRAPISTAPSAPYASAEATRSPTSHYNHYAPHNRVSSAPQYAQQHAPQQLYSSQHPSHNVAQAAPSTNSPPPPQGSLIFELRHCSPEEQRAKLPRYVTKPRCATTS